MSWRDIAAVLVPAAVDALLVVGAFLLVAVALAGCSGRAQIGDTTLGLNAWLSKSDSPLPLPSVPVPSVPVERQSLPPLPSQGEAVSSLSGD